MAGVKFINFDALDCCSKKSTKEDNTYVYQGSCRDDEDDNVEYQITLCATALTKLMAIQRKARYEKGEKVNDPQSLYYNRECYNLCGHGAVARVHCENKSRHDGLNEATFIALITHEPHNPCEQVTMLKVMLKTDDIQSVMYTIKQ